MVGQHIQKFRPVALGIPFSLKDEARIPLLKITVRSFALQKSVPRNLSVDVAPNEIRKLSRKVIMLTRETLSVDILCTELN